MQKAEKINSIRVQVDVSRIIYIYIYIYIYICVCVWLLINSNSYHKKRPLILTTIYIYIYIYIHTRHHISIKWGTKKNPFSTIISNIFRSKIKAFRWGGDLLVPQLKLNSSQLIFKQTKTYLCLQKSGHCLRNKYKYQERHV